MNLQHATGAPQIPVNGMLRWGGFILIMSIAVLRCVIVFAPQVMFDVDPVQNMTPLGGVGPGGSLLLDVLLLIGCAAALLGETRASNAIDWRLLVLAIGPTPIILWHGWSDAGDLWRGSTWSSAAIAAATLAHLARERNIKVISIALLAAVMIPLLLRGANQVTYEHAEMMEVFEERREQFLAERGWEADSSAARMYERRLRQPEPLGWFATTNIYASLIAFGLIIWTGLGMASLRARLQNGWSGLMILSAAGSAAMLWISGSKGAIGAALIGLGLGAILDVTKEKFAGSNRWNRYVSGVPLALLAITLLAVIVHGTLIPERMRELSLLFRWHYMVAATRVMSENPLFGVGPDGFQQAYTLHRVPTNPEEVSSAHSVFIDWIAMLGVGGVAWCALALMLAYRAAHAIGGIDIKSIDQQHSPDATKIATKVILLVLPLVFVSAFVIELSVNDERSIIIRNLALAGYAAMSLAMVHIILRLETSRVQQWLTAAAVALLIHAQIEMTFFQPGTIVWLMCALGVAGANMTRPSESRSRWGAFAALVIALQAGWVAAFGAWPALRQDQAMLRAAESLRPAHEDPQNAILALSARRDAAAQLIEAYEIWPINVRPIEAAAVQLQLAAEAGAGPEAEELLREAVKVATRAVAEHGKPSSIALAATANARLALQSGDQQHWDAAIMHGRRMTDLDPHGISGWRRLGDLRWLANRRDAEAQHAYERALHNDERFALDELKRLTPRQRTEIEDRIRERASTERVQP